jgi:hypothetical protein
MTYQICVDCAMAHANGDFENMDEDTEQRVKRGMSHTGPLAVTGETTHFSWSRCDACWSTLGGDRLEAISLEQPE